MDIECRVCRPRHLTASDLSPVMAPSHRHDTVRVCSKPYRRRINTCGICSLTLHDLPRPPTPRPVLLSVLVADEGTSLASMVGRTPLLQANLVEVLTGRWNINRMMSLPCFG